MSTAISLIQKLHIAALGANVKRSSEGIYLTTQEWDTILERIEYLEMITRGATVTALKAKDALEQACRDWCRYGSNLSDTHLQRARTSEAGALRHIQDCFIVAQTEALPHGVPSVATQNPPQRV